MMPAAPLVGAVTMRPPAAFSSLTARANRETQSIACSGSFSALSLCRRRCRRLARRLTLRPPGSTPSLAMPRWTHSDMTCHRCRISARISASVRPNAFSFSSISAEIDRPVVEQCLRSSSPVVKG